jgi:hypothetical protein
MRQRLQTLQLSPRKLPTFWSVCARWRHSGHLQEMPLLAGSGHERMLAVVAMSVQTVPPVDWTLVEIGAMAEGWLQRWVALMVLAVLMVIAAPMQARAQGTDDLAALREQVG